MKNLLSTVAVRIIENNFSNESIYASGAVIKESFIMQGFSSEIANEFAVDALKIVMNTISKIKV
tara:strand:+ start:303 stop:494 length:192 start_codon:yes stop_codon:yes gene_type:complete